MDYLIRKVLTETEYAAQKTTLKPTDGVVIVSDVDPTDVVGLAIGKTEFPPASGSFAPATASYITNTDETTVLTNSVNLGALTTPNGATGILLNKPTSVGSAGIDVLDLTDNSLGFIFVGNNGTPSQTRYLDFVTTTGKTALTFTGIDGFLLDAESFEVTSVNAAPIELNGGAVTTDTGFDGPYLSTNYIDSNTTDTVFRRKDPLVTYKVSFQNNVDVDLQGPVYTNFTSDTGTDVVVGAGNRMFLKTSSRRFKENITPLEITTEQLSNVLKLEPVTYTYKNGSDETAETPKENIYTPKKCIGLVAEDVFELFPEIVNLDEEGKPFSIDYGALAVILVNAVKQLQMENTQLLDRIEAIEKKLEKS